LCASSRDSEKPAFGPWLQNLRVYLQLTQKEIARIARVTAKEVNSLENNEPLPADTRHRIMKALNSMRLRNWKTLTNC